MPNAPAFWTKACAETDGIANISDCVDRNREITKLYADMYMRNRELSWVGAAAFVSKDIGGELSKLSTISVWRQLAFGNKIVFADLYRYFRYYELMKQQFGRQALAGYTKFLPADTAPEVVDSLERLPDPLQERAANERLLQYEQEFTVQNRLYNSKWFRVNLDMTRMTRYHLGIVDVCFQHQLPEHVPAENRIVFGYKDGRIYNYADRIKYSDTLLQRFCSLADGEASRADLETELQALSDYQGETPGCYAALRQIRTRVGRQRFTTLSHAIPK